MTNRNDPAIVLQVQTYRFQGHSPADPEHERGRKEEKRWARATQDPITIFETEAMEDGTFTKVNGMEWNRMGWKGME